MAKNTRGGGNDLLRIHSVRCMGCMQEYDEFTPNGDPILICPYCGYIKDTPAKEAYHLTPGSILQGKYIVGRVLGYGGFGVTYIGYDAQLDRKVAIKEYLPTNFSTRMAGQTKLSVYDGENGEQFYAGLNSFVEEAKRLSKFNSLSGTVDIYDSFLENETGYIVMEYLDGKTVKEEMAEKGVFEYAAAKLIVLKILDTLKEIHKDGIIHRDIAPDNIFLLDGGEVRLIDFGASRYATTLHSKSLSVILKPGYAPEEQYRSRGMQGPWSDIYALAATFYKMITGITPEESMERMMKDGLKEPSKLGVELPQNDENAIMNALLVKASDRTQSADEFERQLTAEDEVKRAASTLEKYDSGRMPRWARLLASCIGVVVVVFGVLILTGVIDLANGGFVSALTGGGLASNETRVPNVVNEQYERAVQLSDDANLLLVVTNKEYNDKVEAGKVMSQDPLSGRIRLKESALAVVVSGGAETGSQQGVMPDVVFRNVDDAVAMLEAAGIKYKLEYEESDTVAKDVIISMSANVGDKLASGEEVTIVVSQGSAKQDNALENAVELYYQVSFADWNGTVLSTQNVKEGKNASAPGNPTRYGYRFTGWNQNFTNVTADMTVKANYEKLPEYTVTFRDYDGTTLDTQTLPEGSNASAPTPPYRYGFDFTGWDTNVNNVRSNVVATAQYKTVPVFNVTWQDSDGTVLKTEQINRGDNATPPSNPSLTGYDFSGWSSGYTNIRKDTTLTAQYKIKVFAVTWVDFDSRVIKTEKVNYGGNAQGPAPANPTRTGYTFSGWSPASLPTNVTSDTQIAAQYTVNLYTVTFVDWSGTTLKTQPNVPYGSDATPPSNPTRTGYTLTGWSPSYKSVQGNLTTTAQYTINVYTVTWADWDGRVIKTENVKYGESAVGPIPANPSRTGYTFNGWPALPTNVTSNTTITAQYTVIYYPVTFVDWNGTVIKTQQVAYGSAATPPANPTRTGYTFTGWSSGYSNITGNLTVTAQYTINIYVVKWVDWDGRVLKTENVQYGGNAQGPAPANPSRTGYTFNGWLPASLPTNVSSDVTITAQYTINLYPVTFVDWNGTVLKAAQQIAYGSAATPPANPSRSGYRFTGWSPSYTNITGSLTVTAQYVQLQYRYRDQTTGTFSTNAAPSGGEFISSTTNYSAWGGWNVYIDWTANKPAQPANTATTQYQTVSRVVSVGTQYNWVHYVYWYNGTGPNYYPRAMTSGGGYNYTYVCGPERYSTTYMLSGGVYTDMGYYYPGAAAASGYNWWFLESTSDITQTQYQVQVRTCSIISYSVTYWPANWSAWQDAPVTATSTRQVQSQDKT